MTILGPSPLPPIQRSDDSGLALRLNQRIAAEVMQVAGDRVALVIEGVKIVARMTSNEQAAMLEEHRFASFVVRDVSGPVITLQLIPPAAAQPQFRAAPDLIPNLLQVSGIPVNEWTLQIGRALLNQGLPVTPDQVAELQEFLADIDGWGQQHAQIAAAIKSAGLPLTKGALELLMQQPPPVSDTATQLVTQLQALLRKKLPPELAALAQESLAMLKGVFVEDGDPAVIKAMLQQAVKILGRSLESSLQRMLQESQSDDPKTKSSLLTLAALRQQLSEQNETGLVKDIDRFFDRLRLNQFSNLPPSRESDDGRWLKLELPLSMMTGSPPQPNFPPAHIRIAYPPDPEQNTLDPANTRLVIAVELSPGSVLQVDLSVVDRRIGALVIASDELLKQSAEEELGALASGLEELGYSIQTSACQVKPLDAEETQVPVHGILNKISEIIIDR